MPWCRRAHTRSREYLKYIKPRSVILYEHFFVNCLLSYPQRTAMRQRNLVFWSTTTASSSHVADLSKFSMFQPCAQLYASLQR